MKKLKSSMVLAMSCLCVMAMCMTGCKQKKVAETTISPDTVIFEEMEVIEFDEDEIWADENILTEEDIWAD